MRELPRAAAVYVLAVIAAGLGVLAGAASGLPHDPLELGEVGLFAALAVLADLNRLVLSYEASYSVATAVNFAAAIVFGPQAALWIAATSSAVADIHKKKPPYKVAFNAAAIGMSVAAGGAALRAVRVSPEGQLTPQDLPAFAAYAAVNILVNHLILCVAIGLATHTRPWDVARANYRGLFVPIVALFPLGVLMAVTYVYFGQAVGILLLIVPVMAVYNALDRAQQLRVHTQAALEALADTIDCRDRYTAEHSRRVAHYADQIGAQLGMSLADRETLVAAARVHDLGKISIPDAILRKQAELNLEEWEMMRQHPRAGEAILEKLPMYREHALLVGSHHERFDGKGYPQGAGGEAIPLGARILAVADAYDAMTSDRPYRAAMPTAVAVARLRQAVGTQFSREAVEALASALGAQNSSAVPEQPPLTPVVTQTAVA